MRVQEEARQKDRQKMTQSPVGRRKATKSQSPPLDQATAPVSDGPVEPAEEKAARAAEEEIDRALEELIRAEIGSSKAAEEVIAVDKTMASANRKVAELKAVEAAAIDALNKAHEATLRAKSAIVKKRQAEFERLEVLKKEQATADREAADVEVAKFDNEVNHAASSVAKAEAAKKAAVEVFTAVAIRADELREAAIKAAEALEAVEVEEVKPVLVDKFVMAPRSDSPEGGLSRSAATKKGEFYSSFVSLTEREKKRMEAMQAIVNAMREEMLERRAAEGRSPPKPICATPGRILASTASYQRKVLDVPVAQVIETPFLVPRYAKGMSTSKSASKKKKKKKKKDRVKV